MIMLDRWLALELFGPMVVRQKAVLDQIEFFQQVERPIYGGEIDARVVFLGATVQLVGVEVAAALLNDLQEQRALGGNTLATCAQQTARLIRCGGLCLRPWLCNAFASHLQ